METKKVMKNHCECCGAENPETSDGYTVCCNELVCHGRIKILIDFDSGKKIRACCWGMVERLAENN